MSTFERHPYWWTMGLGLAALYTIYRITLRVLLGDWSS